MGKRRFSVRTRRRTSFTRLVGNSLPAAVLAKWFPRPEKVNPAMKKANARRASLFLIERHLHLQLVSAQSDLLHEQISKAHVKADSHASLGNGSQACQGLADSEGHYFYNSKWSNRPIMIMCEELEKPVGLGVSSLWILEVKCVPFSLLATPRELVSSERGCGRP